VVKDANGNVISTTNYTYNAMNQLTAVNGSSLTYDDNRNLIDDGEKLYSWDADGRITQVKKKADGSIIADYAYDEDGRRVRSTINGQVTKYVYDGDSIRVLYETNASNQMTRYYTYSGIGNLLSMTVVGGATYFYHTNAHGDVIAVTDANNNTVATYTYDAWGNITAQNGSFADDNPYRYAGYHYDKETGLYYLMARYYNPKYGNFLSQDPDPGDKDDPITQNGYTYANNNPVMGVDPDGHWVWFLINAGFAAYDGYQAYKAGKGWKRIAAAAVVGMLGGGRLKFAGKSLRIFSRTIENILVVAKHGKGNTCFVTIKFFIERKRCLPDKIALY
jgi:RHS repeat-associated protein